MWKIIVYSFFTVHMPWCTVHVPWTMHQALVFKKKKKRAKNTQTWKLKCECAVQTGPVYQVIGLYLLIHKSKKWSKLVGESIPIKTSKNLTFNILKPIFITYNTPLYNISYIKNSIFLIFHLNILSLLFFIHFFYYFSLSHCLSIFLNLVKLLPPSDICSQNLHGLTFSSSSPINHSHSHSHSHHHQPQTQPPKKKTHSTNWEASPSL